MPIYIGPRNTTDKVQGDVNAPQDVKRRRRDVENIMRRMGTPMLHKHRYNDRDFKNGIVDKSEVYDDIYEQTRNRDPLSYGVGYVSKELSTDEWYNDVGTIVKSGTSPGTGWTQAPRYRGYGPGTITYIIEPDRAEDFFKATPGGPLFKVQTAMGIAPWWPDMNDNDLLINVSLDAQGNIVDTFERFELKNVNPVSMRGLDSRGRKEYTENFGNSRVMNQTFEMTRIPENDIAYEVEVDR